MNKSYWQKAKIPRFPTIATGKQKTAKTDVVVIGGGLAKPQRNQSRWALGLLQRKQRLPAIYGKKPPFAGRNFVPSQR